MKTPPFLLGAALVFWGWQTGFLAAGVAMALVLESARFIKARWEFSDEDFSRIWTVCTLLFLGAAVYAFTDNGGPARFSRFLQNPTPSTQTSAGIASARTAAAVFRWLPMFFFLFTAAQAYSPRSEIPWTTLSPILRRRWKRAERAGRRLPPPSGMNVSYPYLAICLFAGSVHAGEDNSYFWGFCALLTWALWVRRTRRFGIVVWACALAVAFVLGNFGQQGIGRLQSYFQNLDPEWLARFVHRRGYNLTQSRTSLGEIGRVKTSGKIVIRLEPKEGSEAPGYLREASYRIFSYNNAPNGVWLAGGSKENFEIILNETNNSTTWLLIPGKINALKANISCYLEGQSRESQAPVGILPLPTGCGRLENLPAFALKKNSVGVVLAEGPGLVVFDALFSPGATLDSPFNPAEAMNTNTVSLPGSYWASKNRFTNDLGANPNPDLHVPASDRAALDQVIAELRLPRENRDATLRAINGWFQNNFHYTLWQELPTTKSNLTPLSRFLVHTKTGHCEYFASATVLLLRQLHIPARYAVGYSVHETSGNGYVIRQRDAHAWCLVWNERSRTWQDFDTTPASWIEEESKLASPFQRLSDFWSWIEFEFSKFRWGQSNIRQYLLIALVPVLGLLMYQIFFRRRRHRRKDALEESPVRWLGLDSEFYLVERKLAARGLRRAPDEPLSHWLRRAMADPAIAAARDPLRDLLRLHYRYRFDPQGLAETDREALRRGTTEALAILERQSPEPAGPK